MFNVAKIYFRCNRQFLFHGFEDRLPLYPSIQVIEKNNTYPEYLKNLLDYPAIFIYFFKLTGIYEGKNRMWLENSIALLPAYLLGSIPSAYLLVKWRYHRDVTTDGSGNVGTMNVFRTTRSKPLSVLVLLMDFSKGLLAAGLARQFFSADPFMIGAAAVLAVLGHNYPVWLKFHGGRGLATGAGVMVLLAPSLAGVWLVLWALVYSILRKVIYASVLVTSALFIFIWWPGALFVANRLAIPVSIICILILIKHIPGIRDIWLKSKAESIEY